MPGFPSGITCFYNGRRHSAVSLQLLSFGERVGIKAGVSLIKQKAES
jgi:hypothetical protein